MTETTLSLAPIQMGSRVYLSTLGRFASVDPVPGGTPNNYAYVLDPINSGDYSGMFGLGDIGGWIASNPFDAAGYALEAVGLGVCIFATAGVCAIAAGVALWGGGALAAASTYQGTHNIAASIGVGALTVGLGKLAEGMAGSGLKAVRYFGETESGARNYRSVLKALATNAGRSRLKKQIVNTGLSLASGLVVQKAVTSSVSSGGTSHKTLQSASGGGLQSTVNVFFLQ